MIEDAEYLKRILPKLREEMPYKWRVQSFSKHKPQAACVAYIDARDVQDRLDDVCEYGWERDHKELKEHIYAGIGIWMPHGDVLWRWDCGVESKEDEEKGEASDSFKRAAVNWGIGRFLYAKKIIYVDASEIKTKDNSPHVVDKNGNKVFDLTEHINKTKNRATPAKPSKSNVDDLPSDPMSVMEFDELLGKAKDNNEKRVMWTSYWEGVKPQCGEKELEKFKKICEEIFKK